MSSTEELLVKLAESIKKENTDLYNLHFLKIITYLQKEFQIAAGSKAGSIEKGVDTEESDLDIIFYINNLTDNNLEEIRNEICEEIGKKYKDVECKDRSIRINLSNNEHIDSVLKDKSTFENEKDYIRFVKNINEERKNAIKLVKYWKQKTNYNGKNLKSWQLEKYAIYSTGKSLEAIVKDTVHHFSANASGAITILKKEAEKI